MHTARPEIPPVVGTSPENSGHLRYPEFRVSTPSKWRVRVMPGNPALLLDLRSGRGLLSFEDTPAWSDLKRGQVDHYESFVVPHYPKSVVRPKFGRAQKNAKRLFGCVDEIRRNKPPHGFEIQMAQIGIIPRWGNTLRRRKLTPSI